MSEESLETSCTLLTGSCVRDEDGNREERKEEEREKEKEEKKSEKK